MKLFKKKKVVFLCKQWQILDLDEDNGLFLFSELKEFSKNNENTTILIRKYAIIENGKMEFLQ